MPAHSYEQYVRGELALSHGAPEEAARAFQLALAAPEVDPYVLSRLALALGLSGDTEGAARVLADAEQLSPCSPQLWIVRGRLAERAGERSIALVHYQRALDCAPDDAEARSALLTALRAQGAELRAQHLEGTRAGAADEPARVRMGRLLQTRGVSESEREVLLEQALEQNDDESLRRLEPPDSLCGSIPPAPCARLHASLGEYERAARAWSSAAPLKTSELREAAIAYARAHWWAEAEVAARAALAAPQQDADALTLRTLLARARRAQGHDDALELLPRNAPGELRAWLAEAGLPGLAAELRTLDNASPAAAP